MSEMTFCDTCGHRYSSMCSSCATLNGVPVKYKKKAKIRYDEVKAMNIIELAKWLCRYFSCYTCPARNRCTQADGLIDWLIEEVKE